MRKTIVAALVLAGAFCFAGSPAARAQSPVNVTATVLDPIGIPYANATVSILLIPSGTAPTVGGQQISATNNGQLDANGRMNVSLYKNTDILPALSQWQFTICETPGVFPPLGTGGQCFTSTQTVSAAVSFTTQFTAAARALTTITLGSGTIAGSIAVNQVAIGTAANTIGGSSDFTSTAGVTKAGTVAETPTGTFSVQGPGLGTKYGGGPTLIEIVSTDENRTPLIVRNATSPVNSFTAFQSQNTGQFIISTLVNNILEGSLDFNSDGTWSINEGVTDASIGTDVAGNVDIQTAGGASVNIGSTGVGGSTGKECFLGVTSGTACVGAADVAGTPNPVLLPTTSGSLGQVLVSNGANPQQTSWAAAPLNVNVSSYGAIGDARTNWDQGNSFNCTFAVSSTVTCTDLSFTALDTGKKAAGLCSAPTVLPYAALVAVTFVNSTTVTTSPAATAGCFGNLILGTDNTAAFVAAEAALTTKNGTVYVPDATSCSVGFRCSYLVNGNIFNVTGTNNYSLIGQSEDGSLISGAPTFIYPGGTIGQIISWGNTGRGTLNNISVDMLGYAVSQPNLTLVLLGNNAGTATNFSVKNWESNNLGNGSTCVKINSDGFTMSHVHIGTTEGDGGKGCGDTGLDVHTLRTDITDTFISVDHATQALRANEQVGSYKGGFIGNNAGNAVSVSWDGAGVNDVHFIGPQIAAFAGCGINLTTNGNAHIQDVMFGAHPGHGTTTNMSSICVDGTSTAFVANSRLYANGTGKHFTVASGGILNYGNLNVCSTGTGLEVGCSITNTGILGVSPNGVGSDVQVAKATAQTAKTLFTTSGVTTLYRVHLSVECTTTSAAATVTPSVLYTDTSNTVQTVAGTAAACTTLGAASNTSQDVTFRAKNATNIQYQTTIINTPTYDVSVTVEQLGVN